MFYLILGFIHIENKVSCYCRIVATDSFKDFEQVSSMPMCKPRLLFFFFLREKTLSLLQPINIYAKTSIKVVYLSKKIFLPGITGIQVLNCSVLVKFPCPTSRRQGQCGGSFEAHEQGEQTLRYRLLRQLKVKAGLTLLFCQVSPERHQWTNREQNGSPEGNKKVQIKTMVLSSTVAKATWGLVIIWN